jgi:transposase
MIQITPQMRIVAAIEPADFRRGIDGLARLCKDVLKHDPFSGWVFVFRNRSAKALKVLVYDGQGFWLCHKRLSRGRFGWWPSSKSGSDQASPGARTVAAHQLQVLISAGDPCPECEKGTVYETSRPGVLVRIVGQSPIQAKVYELQKLRCNLCGMAFTAQSPDGVGSEKYDATSGSMIALADATDFDERDANRNFDYDCEAYDAVKRNLSRLVGLGQLRLAMELSLELMKRGSQQVEMSDEGLMSDDIEECLEVVIKALKKCGLPPDEVIAWCKAMLKSDRVGFICNEELRSLQNHFQAQQP